MQDFAWLKIRVRRNLLKAIKIRSAVRSMTMQDFVEEVLRREVKIPPPKEVAQGEAIIASQKTLADRVVAYIREQPNWITRVTRVTKKFGIDLPTLERIVAEKRLQLSWGSPDSGWHKVHMIKDPRLMWMEAVGVKATVENLPTWEKTAYAKEKLKDPLPERPFEKF